MDRTSIKHNNAKMAKACETVRHCMLMDFDPWCHAWQQRRTTIVGTRHILRLSCPRAPWLPSPHVNSSPAVYVTFSRTNTDADADTWM